MFVRLLTESFVRQRRRKALAAVAILLGTTAVTAMLALATTIGDHIHKELAVYGANIVVTPKADGLAVKVGGVDLKPATGGAYLRESDLDKLKGIFWANNITGVSPEYRRAGAMSHDAIYSGIKAEWLPAIYASQRANATPVDFVGYWFDHRFGSTTTGAPQLHPWWHLRGRWPSEDGGRAVANSSEEDVVIGSKLAHQFGLNIGDQILLGSEHVGKVVGIVSSGDGTEENVMYALDARARLMRPIQGAVPFPVMSPEVNRVDVSAKTRPEDALARMDPEKLSPKQHDLWYCRPYANSIAYQIMEAIPGSRAEQVRRVEQSEGTVLSRISGLMWLVSLAALLAAGFAVSAAMATAVLERRGEIGLMRSLGASKGAIALLFYAESGVLAVVAGVVGFAAGSGLAWWLGGRVFAGSSGMALNWALLPVVVGLALGVAVAGSTPSIRAALRTEPSQVLRGGG